MPSNCAGWGLDFWGVSSWGSADFTAPKILSINPPCGAVNVDPCRTFTIKVADIGCAGLDVSCAEIIINGLTVFDGSLVPPGTPPGAGFDVGFQAPCAGTSSFTTEVDPVYGTVWVFNLSCGCFECSSVLVLSATFCDLYGHTTTLSECGWRTVDCFIIENIEILDNRHFQLNFSNPFTIGERLNPALYDFNSYVVTPVLGGLVEGTGISLKSVFIEKSITAKYVILELKNPVTPGAMYQFTASRLILDMYKQNLRSRGNSLGLVRRTKVDKVISNLPQMYSNSFTSVFDQDQHFVSPYHIIAASAVEDEKIGGDF
ncbi:MAG TPA: hypothetical protein EYO71_11975 [Rhodospirillales bacterium]|nr:hypothetical protein [Rhodospirillales bacterium]